jgi:ketosteroid isomerase-like protein
MQDTAAIANALSDAIETGDVARLRTLYAPDVEIWHNTDGVIQTLDENLTVVVEFFRQVGERRFENRKLGVFPGGFVQQHQVTGVRGDGRRVGFEACIVCRVADGRITRLDEYFDSAAVAAAFQ